MNSINYEDNTPLSAIQVHISRLNELPASELNKFQMFLIADKIGSSTYLSKQISFGTLSSALLEGIRTENEMSFINKNNPKFIFDNDKRVHIKTSIINHWITHNRPDCAINIEFLYNNILQKIYDLSAEIYGSTPDYPYSHVPSRVGEVITSRRLNNLEAVRQTYGKYTTWVEVTSFVLGIGPNKINTTDKYGEMAAGKVKYTTVGTTGGVKEIKLTSNEIPKHSHGFRASPCHFTLAWKLGWELEEGSGFFSGDLIKTVKHKYGNDEGCFQVKRGSSAAMTAHFSGQGKLKTADFRASLENTVYDSSGNLKVGTQTSHSNIPPYIVEYMWRRTI